MPPIQPGDGMHQSEFASCGRSMRWYEQAAGQLLLGLISGVRSFQCRASNARNFYRLGACPQSIAGETSAPASGKSHRGKAGTARLARSEVGQCGRCRAAYSTKRLATKFIAPVRSAAVLTNSTNTFPLASATGGMIHADREYKIGYR